MTPEQRKLAHHALGLPNKTNRSYQNYYSVREVMPAHAVWDSMVKTGWSEIVAKYSLDFLSNSPTLRGHMFRLTRAGALLALDEGESLNPEDFPEGGE